MIELDINKLPKHIGLIMDGNGRWAQKKKKPRLFGHRAGVDALREIVRVSDEIGIKVITVYAFSTENWKRSEVEVKGIMKLLINHINKELKELHKNNVKIKIVGDLDDEIVPVNVKKALRNAEIVTEHNTGLHYNIAFNYGGRREIISGFKRIISNVIDGDLNIEDINEDMFHNYLYTAEDIDPDLIIRTSGEERLSNFLIWQSAYSEFYFTDILWPDFNREEYIKAISAYQNRKRRFGGIIKGEKNES
jgi:undecaprenyl diphosphate synthase